MSVGVLPDGEFLRIVDGRLSGWDYTRGMEGVLGCRKCLMGPRSYRNFRRLSVVRLAVVTNRVRGLAGSARTILLRPIVVAHRCCRELQG